MVERKILDHRLLVEKLIEDKLNHRAHGNRIGASALAAPCDRQIWYQWRWVKQPEGISAQLKRLFNRGNQEEPVVYAELEEAGVIIIATQEHMTFINGFCGGIHDGIITKVPDAPKTDHLLEIKTANQKNFDLIRRNKVRKAKPDHFTQMQVYMHLWKLKRALYVCTNKNTDERYYERVPYDKNAAAQAMARAAKIVTSESPPPRVANTLDDWPCKWCAFKEICHHGAKIKKTCRSCEHMDLHDDGVWHCSKKGKDRSKKAQEKGCKQWLRLPGL